MRKACSQMNCLCQAMTTSTAVKLKKGQPWCAAFVSWVFAKAGYTAPRTGWSPALFNTQEILP